MAMNVSGFIPIASAALHASVPTNANAFPRARKPRDGALAGDHASARAMRAMASLALTAID